MFYLNVDQHGTKASKQTTDDLPTKEPEYSPWYIRWSSNKRVTILPNVYKRNTGLHKIPWLRWSNPVTDLATVAIKNPGPGQNFCGCRDILKWLSTMCGLQGPPKSTIQRSKSLCWFSAGVILWNLTTLFEALVCLCRRFESTGLTGYGLHTPADVYCHFVPLLHPGTHHHCWDGLW